MRLLVVLLCGCLYLVEVVQAVPTANTTNTTTNDSFKAPSFTTRTLWTIVSSSVLTLFACIYTAIHPNIPSPKDNTLHILRRRVGIMIMALIAPELIVAWAMRQWFSARQVTRQFKKLGYPSVGPQSESYEEKESVASRPGLLRIFHLHRIFHLRSFFRLLRKVLAKGTLFVLAFLWHFPGTLVRWVKSLVKADSPEQSEDYMWTETHSFFVLMGGFMLYVDEEPYHTLQPDEVLDLIRAECIDAPTLTAKQIHDKSKGNAISKGLIILQVAWFVMQLITRAIYHLETTQLEVGTLAFAVLNFLTYAVWWNKPLNVQCPHPVYWKSTKSRPDSYIDHSERDELAPLGILAPVFRPIIELTGLLSAVPTSRKLRVLTFDGSIKLKDLNTAVLLLAGLLMATTFGGIHCMAWSFAFPTYLEHLLWRISAVVITCTPWPSFFTLFLFNDLNMPTAVYIIAYALYVMLYVAARAILLVLMFTTLRDLPHDSDVFKAVLWTSLVPHL